MYRSLEDTNIKTIRSVFAIFVEQMQNVIRYSAERVPEDGVDEVMDLSFGFLTIGKKGDEYVLLSGNLIRNEDIERVSDRLLEIQSMDHDQLKRFYKKKLKEGPDEFSQGAGVGFIEIARRASQPIEFDFAKLYERVFCGMMEHAWCSLDRGKDLGDCFGFVWYVLHQLLGLYGLLLL